jgi:hypothetical protein
LPPALANGLFLISLSCGSMLILWMDDRKRWP